MYGDSYTIPGILSKDWYSSIRIFLHVNYQEEKRRVDTNLHRNSLQRRPRRKRWSPSLSFYRLINKPGANKRLLLTREPTVKLSGGQAERVDSPALGFAHLRFKPKPPRIRWENASHTVQRTSVTIEQPHSPCSRTKQAGHGLLLWATKRRRNLAVSTRRAQIAFTTTNLTWRSPQPS